MVNLLSGRDGLILGQKGFTAAPFMHSSHNHHKAFQRITSLFFSWAENDTAVIHPRDPGALQPSLSTYADRPAYVLRDHTSG